MGLLDRIAAEGGEPRADVQPLVAAYQGAAPQAYQAAAILPDPGALAAFMAEQNATAGGLLIHRDPAP
jgi:hypothetical protein